MVSQEARYVKIKCQFSVEQNLNKKTLILECRRPGIFYMLRGYLVLKLWSVHSAMDCEI